MITDPAALTGVSPKCRRSRIANARVEPFAIGGVERAGRLEIRVTQSQMAAAMVQADMPGIAAGSDGSAMGLD
jgi:hypothetical protein